VMAGGGAVRRRHPRVWLQIPRNQSWVECRILQDKRFSMKDQNGGYLPLRKLTQRFNADVA